MSHHGGLKNAEANDAAWEAGRGAVTGASKWAVFGATVGVAGYALSPVYRGLTFQFKVFIQMSAMIMGGCLGADRRLRDYEAMVRVKKRMLIDRAALANEEEEYEARVPAAKGGR